MINTSPAPTPAFDNPDRLLHAQLARLSGGISPAALRMAFDDWLTHLSLNPAQQAELMRKLLADGQQSAVYALQALAHTGIPAQASLPPDRRFASAAWTVSGAT